MKNNDHNDHEKHSKKNGFTVGEIQGKMKKYGLEISLCAIFILTGIFTLIWGGIWVFWAIVLCMVGAVLGILFPMPINKVVTKALEFIYKEKFTSIVIAVLGIVLAVFLPPIIFALVGVIAGKSFALHSRTIE